MAAGTYRIDDEPRPGGLAHLTVQPFWPMLSMMLAGAWLGLPWFIVNSLAMGSATRRRELVVVALTVVATTAFAVAAAFVFGSEALPISALRYAMVLLSVLKLGAAYYLFTLQARSFALYEHFGGNVRSGALLLLAGLFIRMQLSPGSAPALLVLILG